MSKLAKNNAKCEIFARYADIYSTDSIDQIKTYYMYMKLF